MVVGSLTTGCQVAVIGAGPGGYLAAIRLAQLKKDVVLIERDAHLGGVCLNRGCIPSKALIHAADFAYQARHGAAMGIHVGDVTVKMDQLVAWKDKLVTRLTDGIDYLMKQNGVATIQGEARFTARRQLEVIGPSGTMGIEFEQVVIATGTSPRQLPHLKIDGNAIIGSDHALSLPEVPAKMAVVGGGAIGLEMAAVFAKLGAEVHLIESQPTIIPQADPEVATALCSRLTTLGVSIHLNHQIEQYQRSPHPEITIRDLSSDQIIKLPVDRILVSVGRIPNTATLGLPAVGVKTDKLGFIQVDDKMTTTTSGIYAIGDVVGGPLLAHKAYKEAKVVADVIVGKPAAFDNYAIPAVVYTDPEVAWAGLSETAAKAKGIAVVVGTFPLSASGRAMTLGDTHGFVKTVADKQTGKILGITIVGPQAGELIAEAALAIEMGAFLDDLAATIHPHPSLSEAILESVDAALGQAVHVIPKG